MGDEDVIRRRLLIDGDGTGDDRRLNVLLKSFIKWCNATNEPPGESQVVHDRMLAQLAQCEFAVSKSRLSASMSAAELQNYENLSRQIETGIEAAKRDIESTKLEFQDAKTVRKNRIEYDVLAKVINEQPDRKETDEKLSQLRRELRSLEETREQLERKLDMRRKQFHVLVASIHQLQAMLDDSESEDIMEVSLEAFEDDAKPTPMERIMDSDNEDSENGIDIKEEPWDITEQLLEVEMVTEECELSLRSRAEDDKYICDFCQKEFPKRTGLRRHIAVHMGKIFKCSTCSKEFSRNSHLDIHRRVHSGEKPYKCEVCSKCFTTKGSLQVHYFIHTGVKSHECDVCFKKFSRKDSLKCHYRIHTNEKLFSCKICFKEFTRSGNLSTHMRVHSGEKPYECDVCSDHFSLKSTLKKHYRKHTGERPYKCEFCSKDFVQSASLAKHKRMHF